LRTIVYIDGFNLYFGSLKNSPYKWLDLSTLAHKLCTEKYPESEIVKIKYFTADIKSKLSRRGIDSCKAQQDYLLAIKAHSPEIEIIKGKYLITENKFHPNETPVPFDKKHSVWRAEEKHTDVNIAIHMLCDSFDNTCEQMVLVSNDSDQAPTLRTIKERTPQIMLGTVNPTRETQQRNSSADLRKYSDWLRHSIKENELANAQLPNRIITRKRPIKRPEHW